MSDNVDRKETFVMPDWAKEYTNLEQILYDMPYFLRRGKFREARALIEVVELLELHKKNVESR